MSRSKIMKKLVLATALGSLCLGGTIAPASAFTLQDVFQGRERPVAQAQAPVIMAQSSADAVRIQQLEEQVRQLTGRLEDMSFQLLQIQENMRKTQEDNEFRFQELEKSGSGGSSAPAVAAAPAAGSKKNTSDEVGLIIQDTPAAGTTPPSASATPPSAGAAPSSAPRSPTASKTAPGETTLGSLEVDKSGQPVGADINRGARNGSASLPGVDTGAAPASDPQQTASLGSESDAYRAAYDHVLSGDYKVAESEFTRYLQAFPKSARAADANFWLGEAQYSQGKYNDAARTFLNAHQTFSTSPKAPEMLLKLGMSLAALDNRETACATLREVSKRYPTASKPVLGKVASEEKRLSC